MTDNNTVEIEGTELQENDTVKVTYHDDNLNQDRTREDTIESFMYATSRRMPTCIKFGAHDSLGEDEIIEIEKTN